MPEEPVDPRGRPARRGGFEPEKAFPTLPELLDYIEEHDGNIYVRADVDGRFGNYSLSELPASEAIHYVCEFIRRGRIAFRVKPQGEA